MCVCKRALPEAEAVLSPQGTAQTTPGDLSVVAHIVFQPQMARHFQITLELIRRLEGEREVPLASGRLWVVTDESPTPSGFWRQGFSHAKAGHGCASWWHLRNLKGVDSVGENGRYFSMMLLCCSSANTLCLFNVSLRSASISGTQSLLLLFVRINNTGRSVCVFSLFLQRSSQEVRGPGG